MDPNRCKICGSEKLKTYAHTATCGDCGVLLYYPYPASDSDLLDGEGKDWPRERVLNWYTKSSFFNHTNFTNMVRFVMSEEDKGKELEILDYGGGGGQFALVCASHFPQAKVSITDMSDVSLLDEWRGINHQILFKDFPDDQSKFDVIFMNDVFEHVSDPLFVLKQLAGKLKPGGRIFIDTPKQFWLYPFTKLFSKSIYTKLLRGTVSTAHLQIWNRASFDLVVREAGLKKAKFETVSEYTMPASYYMKNMGVTNPLTRLAGRLFYANAKWLARNKILAILTNE